MSRRFRVLCMADVSACPEALDPLREVAQVDVVPADRQVLVSSIGAYDAYFATLGVQVDAEVLARAGPPYGRLRAIATPSTGTDHLDLERARQLGIEVLSNKTDYELLDRITATAEMAWCLLLAAVRRLPWAFDAARQGEWARDRFRGHQLAYKTLGILGYGRLGRMVAQYGLAFRMRVIACDIRPFEAEHVRQVDLDTLLRESDVISIHVHLDETTRGMIGRREFALMRDGVVIVNTSRGAVINEDDFLEALRSGKVGAAGVDVIEGEWRTDLQEHPLVRYARQHDNLVISPHVGGVTLESQRMAYTHTARKLAAFLQSLGKGTP